ncbi:MAG: hypothetical protein DMG12_08925 [Acidobacteria bacterium]|nr:MAG: hypothetical protein DMG12_08925 [Acidobacteriota bacterium]
MTKWICIGVLFVVIAAISVWSNVNVFPAPAVVEINSPAGAGSEEPGLSVAPDGRIFLTWLEAGAPRGHVLRFSVREKQGWTTPRTVARGNNWFVNPADFPSLIVIQPGANRSFLTAMEQSVNTALFPCSQRLVAGSLQFGWTEER